MRNFQEAEKLTQEDKMKLWHDGKRGFNFKTATPEKLRTNYKICKKLGFKAECKLLSDELKKRGLKIAGKDLDSVKENRILHERGMTEYGVSHADEIYRDNYERELAKSGDKYIVRPRTQATNRYLTGDFGVRDSYELSFGTLRDLVRTCVNSNDDIELYETGDDYYFKDDGRIYDVLGFVNGSLNESLRNNKKLKESKLSAEQLAKKIDEIAEACGDYYFDTYCGGIAAVDPDEIRDELDEYIIDTTHSGEFVSPHDFPYGKGYSNFCIAAKEAAWECIYFNYDVAKEQVAMNEEYEEEFDESLVKEFFKQKMKEYCGLNGRKDAYNACGDRPLR